MCIYICRYKITECVYIHMHAYSLAILTYNTHEYIIRIHAYICTPANNRYICFSLSIDMDTKNAGNNLSNTYLLFILKW